MADERKPCAENVPGPFYVVDQCCLSCGIPTDYAPDMFAFTKDGRQCFVKRQPETPQETGDMVQVVWSSEVSCIRYRGEDPVILKRLAEMKCSEQSDTPPPPNIPVVVRDSVVFEAVREIGASEIAQLHIAFIREGEEKRAKVGPDYAYKFKPIVGDAQKASFSYAWYKDHFHGLEFRRLEGRKYLGRHLSAGETGGRSISLSLDFWLRREGFVNLKWYPYAEWEKGGEGCEWPQ